MDDICLRRLLLDRLLLSGKLILLRQQVLCMVSAPGSTFDRITRAIDCPSDWTVAETAYPGADAEYRRGDLGDESAVIELAVDGKQASIVFHHVAMPHRMEQARGETSSDTGVPAEVGQSQLMSFDAAVAAVTELMTDDRARELAEAEATTGEAFGEFIQKHLK